MYNVIHVANAHLHESLDTYICTCTVTCTMYIHVRVPHVFIGGFHPSNEPGVHAGEATHRDDCQATDTELYHSDYQSRN